MYGKSKKPRHFCRNAGTRHRLLVFFLFIFHRDQGVFSGEVDSALAVDVGNLDQDLVVYVDDILDLFDALGVQLGDMYQALFAGAISTKAPKFIRRVTLPL